jgi:hypothetical protein
MTNDDDFTAKIYGAFVVRLTQEQRQLILNFLENLGVRVLYMTTDLAPLRILRTGTPERFRETIRP